jgi:hypothetical protein
LQRHRVGVRVKANLGVEDQLWVSVFEVVLYDSGLTSTSSSYVNDTLLSLEMHVEKLGLSSSLSSSNNKRGEDSSVASIERLDLFEPVNPLVLDRVVVVIVNGSTFREFKLVAGTSEVAVELTLALIEASTESPNHGEGIEAIVHVFNASHTVSILFRVSAESVEESFVSLVGSKLVHLIVNDADEGLNASNRDHRLAGVKRSVHHVLEALTDVLVLSKDERVQGDVILLLADLKLGQPGVVVGLPSNITIVDE